MTRTALLLIPLFATFIVGCSLLVGEGLAGGDDDAPPPPPSDGSTAGDGGAIPAQDAADAAAQPNLLSNGDFELGCAGWNSGSGTLAEETIARSGTRSCRVCNKTAGTDFFVHTTLAGLVPQAGEKYVFEAWIREAPGAPRPNGHYVELATRDTQGDDIEELETPGPPVDETWKRSSTLLSVTKPGAATLFVQVGIQPVAGQSTCVLIDDARVFRAP